MIDVVIVGGGLVGTLASIALTKRDFKVQLFESRRDLRKVEPVGSDRSINLALSHRGIMGLSRVGLDKDILARLAIPMKGRMIHDISGKQTEQLYGVYGEVIYSVDRKLLNFALLDLAERQKIEISFEAECDGIQRNNPRQITFKIGANGEKKTFTASKAIIGADGAFSCMRRSLGKFTRLDYSQQYIAHGYKELTILPTTDGDFAISPNHLHIWPRHEFMMIALPNKDKTFTCTLFFPHTLFEKLEAGGPEAISEFFTLNFPDALELVGKDLLISDFMKNPVGNMLTVKCFPHGNDAGNVAILGDAAHCMVPFYGQGMNAGFEDVDYLLGLLDENNLDLEQALRRYSKERPKDTHAICDLALYNYHEMSSHVTSFIYLAEKSVTETLYRFFVSVLGWKKDQSPVIPLYSMVAFTSIPYSQVVARNKWQKTMIRNIFFGSIGVATFMLAIAKGRFLRFLK